MAFDVGIELRGEEIALDHVALELGHVDAVGGEAAERLVERGRHVAHPEQERGDDGAVVGARPSRLARQYDEPRGVVRLSLEVLAENLESVDSRGEIRGDRRARLVPALGDLAGGAGG